MHTVQYSIYMYTSEGGGGGARRADRSGGDRGAGRGWFLEQLLRAELQQLQTVL